MKSLFLCTFLAGMAAGLAAQQLHFVYLQTDSHKPFYILLNKKNYSSSAIGYVILSKLPNGDYPVRIGFPKSEEKEQEFLLQIKDNDQGFLIKDFGNKGLGLFNLQSMNVQYAGEGSFAKVNDTFLEKSTEQQPQKETTTNLLPAEPPKHNDSVQVVLTDQQYADSISAAETAHRQNFADSLRDAKATNAAAEKKKQDEEAAIAEKQNQYTDSLNDARALALENQRLEKIADSTARVQAAAIEKTKAKERAATKTETLPADSVPPHLADADAPNAEGPVLLQKSITDSGWLYIYSVTNNDSRENIDVFIPNHRATAHQTTTTGKTPKASFTIKTPEQTSNKMQETTPAPEAKPADVEKENPVFLNMTFDDKTPETPVSKTDTVKTSVAVLHNFNCRAIASEKDFLSTRKKMAATGGAENMIAVARKIMKEKCFTTEQVRNLGVLFLTDADCYQFLDAAYPFTLDAYRFNTLQNMLKDSYYIQRFKAMIRF